jgi:hypothetical protein
MSKIRMLSFGMAISLIAGGLRANTMTNYKLGPYGIFDATIPTAPDYGVFNATVPTVPTAPDSTIVQPTYDSNISYYYDYSSFQNYSGIASLAVSDFYYGGIFGNYAFGGYGFLNATVPTFADSTIVNNLQPPQDLPLTTLFPVQTIQTKVAIPVIQPSTVSTVTTQVPTIQVTANFNSLPVQIGDLADPEPATVLLFVSGTVVLAILHRKRSKTVAGRIIS